MASQRMAGSGASAHPAVRVSRRESLVRERESGAAAAGGISTHGWTVCLGTPSSACEQKGEPGERERESGACVAAAGGISTHGWTVCLGTPSSACEQAR